MQKGYIQNTGTEYRLINSKKAIYKMSHNIGLAHHQYCIHNYAYDIRIICSYIYTYLIRLYTKRHNYMYNRDCLAINQYCIIIHIIYTKSLIMPCADHNINVCMSVCGRGSSVRTALYASAGALGNIFFDCK